MVESVSKQRFYDIKAVMYYLKCIPWLIDDFSIDKYWDDIKRLNSFIENEGYFDVSMHRFLLLAEK